MKFFPMTNPTEYILKHPQIEDLIFIEEWYDFGGHGIFVNCGEVNFAIFDGNLQQASEFVDNQVYQAIIKEVFVDLDGSVLDFMEKYEVKNG